ncbi:MAG TPA: hypothetical protein VF121_10115 [Thermoanaerobaculia bacterium]|nr:hypothetical protein [Thermoanaerobaculia bacterium]
MTVELNPEEIETLLTSVKFSQDHLRNAPGTPYAIRQENLARLDAAAKKLREARKKAKAT